MTFITTANPDRAGPDQPLGWDAGELAALIADLHHKVLDLAMVGEAETVAMGHTLSAPFPRLAVQALPLPGTRHPTPEWSKRIPALTSSMAAMIPECPSPRSSVRCAS